MAKDKTGSIVTHIDSEHDRGNIFSHERSDAGHPKVKEGVYANAEGRKEE